ncbi:MAG: zinc-dependent metalloprotease [Ignavibacteriae bacterium]|nr:zinc-dependent metalloprotease [Ignavibacteriota bacterium]MCB9215447.1 zinc-dependent metalloprotease [Ignavibacteria bacterium]
MTGFSGTTFRLQFFLTLLLFLFGCSSSKEIDKSEIAIGEKSGTTTSSSSTKPPFKKFSEVLRGDFTSDSGLFPLHFQDDKVYYEIPDSLLGREMLLIVRVVATPEDFSPFLGSGSSVNEMMIRWELKRKKILLRGAATTSIASDSLPVAVSVRNNSFEPIIASFDVEAEGASPDSYLIDVTSFLLDDIAATTPLSASARKQFEVRRLEKDRSWIDSVRSFPLNVEARYILTFSANAPPGNRDAGAMTFEMSQSLVLLPAEPMRPRLHDLRVGWFSLRKIDFGTDEQKAATQRLIRRWRLEPSDPEAYARGELVEPVKPIVYYVDPATPEKWRSWIKKGIEDWSVAFEDAGFKNAIMAKDPPSAEEDPDFSPEDARYSVVRWIANTTRNAVGPSVVDPRTGEIIESDVLFYHNHLKTYRNLYIIECGALDSRARSLKIPDEVLGEMLRAVIAHEVGHALGLPHNMGASYAYSIDSLRTPGFTERMGISASIMDYARLNYVAQPGDREIRLIRKLGPYDKYAINWGYRLLTEAATPEDELATLDRWIREKENDPIYRFGYQQGFAPIDPRSQTEDIGNDAMEASRLGIENLKQVVPNLVEWTVEGYNDYDDLEELYDELIYHWRELLAHPVANVGGVYITPRKPNQGEEIYTSVPGETQRRAMGFIREFALRTPDWLLNEKILRRIEHSGAIDRIGRVQIFILNLLLDEERMARLIEGEVLAENDPYRLLEFLGEVRSSVWTELKSGEVIDVYRRNLQRGYIERMEWLMTTEEPKIPGETRVNINRSDIRPAVRGELEQLKKEIRGVLDKSSDRLTQLHLQDGLKRIERILDPNK